MLSKSIADTNILAEVAKVSSLINLAERYV